MSRTAKQRSPAHDEGQWEEPKVNEFIARCRERPQKDLKRIADEALEAVLGD